MGEKGVLNGLLYCSDCGRRLRIQRDVKTKFQYYVCATYMTSRTGHRECTIHNTPRHLIEPLILSEIQRVTAFAREHESDFVALVEKQNERVANTKLRTAKIELEKSNRRISELDVIIKRIYEDYASGRLIPERYDKMYADYELEQKKLKISVVELSAFIEKEKENAGSISRFLGLVQKYTDTQELTAEIANVFIEKIVCHQANGKLGKNRRQQIDIYWNLIGFIGE